MKRKMGISVYPEVVVYCSQTTQEQDVSKCFLLLVSLVMSARRLRISRINARFLMSQRDYGSCVYAILALRKSLNMFSKRLTRHNHTELYFLSSFSQNYIVFVQLVYYIFAIIQQLGQYVFIVLSVQRGSKPD